MAHVSRTPPPDPAANGNGPTPPQQLTPGMNVGTNRITFAVAEQVGQTPQGPQKIVVLHLEHYAGSTVLAFAPDFAASMGKALLEHGTGGLTVAKELPPSSPWKPPGT